MIRCRGRHGTLTRSLKHRDWRRAKRQADEFAAGYLGPELHRKADAESEPLTLETLFDIYGEEVTPIPVRHDLDEWIAAYLEAGGIDLSSKAAPLFLAAERGGLGLTDRPMTAHGVRQMLKRRLHEAELPEIITPHSFRVMVVPKPGAEVGAGQ